MKSILKLALTVLVAAIAFSLLIQWYQVFIAGQHYRTGGVFGNVLMCLGAIAIFVASFYAFKYINKIKPAWLLLPLAFVAQACNYAHSNVQTLVTHDCGVSWQLIKAGQSVPRGVGNYCFRSVTIPDYPMQGESKFKTNFKNNVKAGVDLDYNYRITDAIAFIGEAKYVGGQSGTEDAKANDTRFETAENVVIDKRIKDVARDMLLNHDIVDFSPSDFEDELLPKVNETLKPLGVQIDFLSFVPVPDEQTAQAIDAATAMRIYKANEMEQTGAEMMKARAGAAKIENVQPPVAK